MRVERAWAIVLAAVGVALCLVPLCNVLGYEFCLVLAVVASLAGAHVGAVRVVRARRERPPSAVTAAEARPGATVARLWLATTLRLWLALLCPLGAVLLNALRVRNCDLGAGLAWFFMLPMLSAALGAALGTVVGLLRGWRGAAAPSLLAIAGVLASIVMGVWRFYAAPPICGYDPFVGYFAGTLYDEEVAITAAFGWARLYHAAVATSALALCALHLDSSSLALGRPRRGLGAWALAFVAVGVAAWLYAARARLGVALDAGDIAHALGAEKRTAHFVLHYSPTGPYAKEIDLYADDHELRWSQLERWFGAAPKPPIHAFLFDNAVQKRALMGAGHTFIAKPWRREIYLQHDAWPQHVTAHELAHVFAGRYGDRLFGIARRGLAFNVGLIEGVAVAASWSGQPLTPHQIVKVLRDARAIDDGTLGRVMGPSFFGLNAAQAYNLAGSFCRFLADSRGTAKLEALYAAAGAPDSWRRIYGVDFDALAAEWRALLDTQVVPPAERAVALERLRRPSVFGRVCAHAQALRKQAAQAAAAAGDRVRALAEWDAVCKDDPADPQNFADALDAAIAADARPQARRLAEALRARQDIDAVLRGRAESALGDLALLDGDVDGARRYYDLAATRPGDESTARLLTVKRLVCGWPAGPSRAALVPILVSPPSARDAAVDLATLQKLADRDRDLALYHYLLARQLFARGRFAETVEELGYPAHQPLPDARFDREATRLQGVALYRLGRIAEARAQFRRRAGDPDAGSGARLDAFDWIDRCDFAETRGAR